jgi:hypothetical protein
MTGLSFGEDSAPKARPEPEPLSKEGGEREIGSGFLVKGDVDEDLCKEAVHVDPGLSEPISER